MGKIMDKRVFFLVNEGEVLQVPPDTQFDGEISVLVYATDENDALRLADLYDRGDLAVDNITVDGKTYAAVSEYK